MENRTLLDVRNLSVSFRMYDRGLSQYELNVISDLSVTVHEGEIMVIVGASGSGKSVLAHAVLGILPSNAVIGGEMDYDGAPLTDAVRKEKVGSEIIMIPQSVNYLDPLMKVGKQVRGVRGSKERQQAAFRRYGLQERVADMYPFQLSGGELQRFCVARVLGPQTEFIIADEMSTMLDAITQAQIWNVLLDQVKKRNLGLLVISHNMALADKLCTRIVNLKELNLKYQDG